MHELQILVQYYLKRPLYSMKKLEQLLILDFDYDVIDMDNIDDMNNDLYIDINESRKQSNINFKKFKRKLF